MNLIIDEGNTAFKLAIFDGNEVVKVKSFDPKHRQEMHSWISDSLSDIQHVIVSSVVEDHLDLSRYNFNLIDLNERTPLPISNHYTTPTTLGRDRIANAVGAWSKNIQGPVLVIDMGTCIKYDLVVNGGYMGGNISPGLHMRLKSLHQNTAKLPMLDLKQFEFGYGIDTPSSIYNGAIQGAYHEINGFIAKYKRDFPGLTIFMTGGDAKFFDKPFICDIFADSDLTLHGLNQILIFNVKKS